MDYLLGRTGLFETETSVLFRTNGYVETPHIEIVQEEECAVVYKAIYPDRVEYYGELDMSDVDTLDEFRSVLSLAKPTKIVFKGETYKTEPPPKILVPWFGSKCQYKFEDTLKNRVERFGGESYMFASGRACYLWEVDADGWRMHTDEHGVFRYFEWDEFGSTELRIRKDGTSIMNFGCNRAIFNACGEIRTLTNHTSTESCIGHFAKTHTVNVTLGVPLDPSDCDSQCIERMFTIMKGRAREMKVLTGLSPTRITWGCLVAHFNRKGTVIQDEDLCYRMYDGKLTIFAC